MYGKMFAGFAIFQHQLVLIGLAVEPEHKIIDVFISKLDPDGNFVWADAKIVGDTVEVSAPTVANPTKVRYAWADNPACNLSNKSGLPAVPFKSDR